GFAVKVPSPLPRRIETVLLPLLATARSSLPSPLKSARTTPLGELPTLISDLLKLGGPPLVISKTTMLELPPPGVGSVTVIRADPTTAMLVEGTVAVRLEPLTKLVESGEPFQLTVAPGTKPEPFTVSVKLAPPGAAFMGESGSLIRGTGLAKPMPVRATDCGLVALSVSKIT